MVEQEEEKTVTCLTTKEIKALARPEFQANPEKFYPVETFAKLGFSRNQCPKCNNFYWRHSETRKTCGDSNCEGSYSFIGNGVGKGKKITYAEAWKGFERSMTTAKVPCTSIKRYPVVARWRNDVDYVAAGIFCFQPYCVTGELEPPANPLICPQFCVRFNDLDNIGLTGRHYSGFIMLGIQVFNYPDNYVFFKDECIEFNYRWLTEELEIEPDEITFIEDVWAGGGNLGPSIEYFVRGLEVGNMVFMQYKTFHDGSREELKIKIIDTGIGLERIAWLYNGTPTSYVDTFQHAFTYITSVLELSVNNEIWEKFGPYSCLLNVDESDNIDKTWQKISEQIGIDVQQVKDAITPIKDIYIILDHTRSVLLTVTDGSLPSNVGGGGNVRNILRRVFSLITKNDWWKKLTFEILLKVFEMHKEDLKGIYGQFDDYKSFQEIIKVEYDRWRTTDDESKLKLDKLLKSKKGVLQIEDWIVAMQSWGIPADQISHITGLPVPGDLYYKIAEKQEKTAKAPETILYQTTDIPETKNMYYDDHHQYEFDAEIVGTFANVKLHNKRNILLLNQSAIYPTSGGQEHDTGKLTIQGSDEEYTIENAVKVGKVVLHLLDKELPPNDSILGKKVHVIIDKERRSQLRAHHTGTHIVFAACREVLGPHVWQNGAKKTTENAHLDITHFKSLTTEEEQKIENKANRIINECHNIEKSFMNKAEAEKEFGFRLYQGGVVPGNNLRVVNIKDVDTEACCGTHCDNTAEVGWIRILKSQRISDGIVRLYYVAQERAIQVLNHEHQILDQLCLTWGVNQPQIVDTAARFFKDYKKLGTQTKKQEEQILSLQLKLVLKDDKSLYFAKSEQANPTLYFSYLPQFAQELQQKGKGVIFIGETFVLGLLGNPAAFNIEGLEKLIKEQNEKHYASFEKKDEKKDGQEEEKKEEKKDEKPTQIDDKKTKEVVKFKEVKSQKKNEVKFDFKEKGKKPVVTKGVLQFSFTGDKFNPEQLAEFLISSGVEELN